jgi:hypothetical protein
MPKLMNAAGQLKKLTATEDDWNLAGVASVTGTRRRGGGYDEEEEVDSHVPESEESNDESDESIQSPPPEDA